jgi:hypothetical protein
MDEYEGTLVLVGAEDPEMDRIVDVLEANGINYILATKGGERVNPNSAYTADALPAEKFKGVKTFILIECESPLTNIPLGVERVVIDHHRNVEGDLGHNKGPELFWEASSLGQLCNRIGLTPSHKDLVLAAMDHNFSAAIRGECYPNDESEKALSFSDAVYNLKIAEIAKTHQVDVQAVKNRVAYFEEQLKLADEISIDSEMIKDLRGENLGADYSLDHLAAQVAVAKSKGVAILYNHLGSFERLTIYGKAAPATFTAFREVWAPLQGYEENVYGSAARGYSGAHRPVPQPPVKIIPH